jgi:amidase
MARNVTDAAVTLTALTGVDPRDPATEASRGKTRRYQTGLRGSLRGARIGVWRAGVTGASPEADAVFETAVSRLRSLGATVVEGADPPGQEAVGQAEGSALVCEFKHDVKTYLAATPGRHPRDLAGLIAFNRTHADRELRWFGQELFELAQGTSGNPRDPACAGPRRIATSGARAALDGTFRRLHLDAVVALTNGPAWTTDLVNGDSFLVGSSQPAAVAGYPSVTVPAGSTSGLPIGISLIGTRWDEQRLLRLAAAWERGTRARVKPTYLPTLPFTAPRIGSADAAVAPAGGAS